MLIDLPSRLVGLFLRQPVQLARQAKIISASGLFDPHWYQGQSGRRDNPRGLLSHYLREGAARGLDPHPLFDTDWYAAQNPDVGATAINPLFHFLQAGGLEGRDPHPLFDSDWYLSLHPSVRELGLNPLVHYLRVGAAAGVDPHPLFKSRWYLAQYPNVRDAGENPLRHYVAEGALQGYDPNPLFDSDWYFAVHPEVAAAGINPLVDYVLNGEAKGRAPSPLLSARSVVARAGTPVRGDLTWEAHRDAAPAPPPTQVEIFAEKDGDAAALRRAIAAAVSARAHLLVNPANASLTSDDIAGLVRRLDADPMVGSVIPRLATASENVLPLRAEDGVAPHDRAVLSQGPETVLAPESLSPCILLRDVLVANFPNSVAGLSTSQGLLRALLAWGRRLGYRALIDNRVVASVQNAAAAAAAISPEDRAQLRRLFPDIATADARFAQLSCHDREALLAAARHEARAGVRTLLVDCSGLAVGHSGSSEAMIGILDGFARSPRGSAITVFASGDALKFHDLPGRYPEFGFAADRLSGAFSAAIRLSQPWDAEDIARLHRHARKIAVLVLDTIGWDIIYSLERDVGPVWRLLAAEADGIAHISAFTRDRFNFRFPAAPHVVQAVAHLSCHYDEYVDAAEAPRGGPGHILLFGNALEHKGLSGAVEVLSKALPNQQFVVVGHSDYRDGNVTSVANGQISTAVIEQLYRGARMTIFPSFYEGFGFPVIRGLAYGLDVVARRSTLLSEIAAQCAPRGRILPFDDPSTLVGAVRRALGSEPVETVPLGSAIAPGGEAVRWRDTADRLMDLLDVLAQDSSIESYDRRERAMRLIARP